MDKLPFTEQLEEIIKKSYNVPGSPASGGDWDLEEIGWVVNDETEDVVTINGESWDDDDNVDNDNDNASVSKMAVDYQKHDQTS